MSTFREFLKENFASNLTKLSSKDLMQASKNNREYSDLDIKNSKFIKLINKTDAVYGVVSYDQVDGEYFVTKITLSTYVDKGIQIENVDQAIDSFPDIKNAQTTLKQLK